MSEIGLGIGRSPEIFPNSNEEVLSWFDENGDRYLRPEEQVTQAEQWAKTLANKLKDLGIDPDSLK
jgi:hypothetical protein